MGALTPLKPFSVVAFSSLHGGCSGNLEKIWNRIPDVHVELAGLGLITHRQPGLTHATGITPHRYETGLSKSWSQVAKSMAVNSLRQDLRESGSPAEVALGSLKWPHLGLGEGEGGRRGRRGSHEAGRVGNQHPG